MSWGGESDHAIRLRLVDRLPVVVVPSLGKAVCAILRKASTVRGPDRDLSLNLETFCTDSGVMTRSVTTTPWPGRRKLQRLELPFCPGITSSSTNPRKR